MVAVPEALITLEPASPFDGASPRLAGGDNGSAPRWAGALLHAAFDSPALYVALASNSRGIVSSTAAGIALAHALVGRPTICETAFYHLCKNFVNTHAVARVAPFFRLIAPLMRCALCTLSRTCSRPRVCALLACRVVCSHQ